MRKKYITIFLALFLIGGLALFNGCKKSSTDEEVILAVSVANGINGSPVSGTTTFSKDSQVVYEYTIKDKYQNLKVTLDGDEVAASGTITMDGNHSLIAAADPVPGDFLLSVATSLGVIGTPDKGNFYYNTGETLDYSYSLEDGYVNLRLTLDGEDIEPSGTIVFDRAHTLIVFADLYHEIRGTWALEEIYQDESAFKVTLVFEGDGDGGTVTDSDGGTGTYEVAGPSVTFKIVYPEVTYEYNGTFVDTDRMTGTSKRIIGDNSSVGSWGATLETTSTTFSRASKQGKSSVVYLETPLQLNPLSLEPSKK